MNKARPLRFFGTAACAALWLMAMTAALFLVIRATIRDPEYFRARYEQIGIEAYTGISVEDCTRAMYQLVEYMEGEAGSIQLTVVENGVEVAMYNEQEVLHMYDVRDLYQGFLFFSYIALFLLALALIGALRSQAWRGMLKRGILGGYGLLAAIIVLLGLWVAVDFNGFWTAFHLLFFDNDLWLMDPAYCRMIRICPLELFYGIVVRAGTAFALLCVGAPLLVMGLWRRLHTRGKGEEAA